MPAKKKVQGFNLAQLDTFSKAVAGVDVPIKHPTTNEPIGEKGSELTVKILGPASRQYRTAQNNIMKALLSKRKVKDDATAIVEDNYDNQNLEVVTACIAGWDNLYFDPEGGEDTDTVLEFNPNNVELVLVHCPWIRRQLEAHIVDESLFMMGSQKN